MLNPAKAKPEAIIAQAQSLLARQKFAEAEQMLMGLLQHKGPLAAAYVALSDVYAAQTGKEGHAAVVLMMASDAAPDDVDILENFIMRTGHVIAPGYDDAAARVMLRCFDHADRLDCSRLVAAWHGMICHHPDIQRAYDLGRRVAFDAVNAGDFAAIKDLRPLLLPLFLRGLENLTVASQPFEEFLTALRQHLLRAQGNADYNVTPEERLRLAVALSHYVHYTDYIFNVTPEEEKAVTALRARIEAAAVPEPGDVAVLACYQSVHDLKNVESLFGLPSLQTVVATQVKARRRLAALRGNIDKLTLIDAGVSSAVQAQYEEFPYPRWRAASQAGILNGWNAIGRNAELAREVYRAAGTEKIKILIAGCGTGMDPLWVSTVFPKADILAVDLSLSSLSYAIDKAAHYNLRNVRFCQADILKLGDAVSDKFDFILSGGVLHHLQDPVRGWRVLKDLLKPGGYMMIGLYSKIARRGFLRAQDMIKEKGFGATASEIRRFRAAAGQLLDQEMKGALSGSSDYFHMPTCRDLLFHVQEHDYDISDLQQMLDQLGLTFYTFSLRQKIFDAYLKKFPDDKKASRLDYWKIFEEENMQTFIQMYMMWLRK